MAICNWPLGNGQTLKFTIYGLDTKWNSVAGLYIFAYWDGNFWRALYVGQTEDFSSRLPNHELLPTVRQYYGSAIHAVSVPLAANRDTWEKMLIRHLQPPLNTQHR